MQHQTDLSQTDLSQTDLSQTDLSDDARWNLIVARDRAWDGRFFYAVVTMGIYCRPSCPSRLPLRNNVRYFVEPADAETAGFRACLRCHPLATRGLDPDTGRIREACAFIRARSHEPLLLAALAARAGLSPFHFQRTFKAVTGVTPRQFVEACRLAALRENLRAQSPVTDAIYEAGFGSSSRVYERVDTRLGMTPVEYRAGGGGLGISWVAVASRLGRMMMAATDRGLCFVQFADRDEDLLAMLRAEYPAAALAPMAEPWSPQFTLWMAALLEHLDHAPSAPLRDLPLDLQATAFQMKVWRYLQSIPSGAVQSYAEVAAALGQPKAARAVAAACAANRVAIAIPCHRVIRGTGELAGYRWGLERKRALIDGERRAAAR